MKEIKKSISLKQTKSATDTDVKIGGLVCNKKAPAVRVIKPTK